jgi:TPR repeat protein
MKGSRQVSLRNVLNRVKGVHQELSAMAYKNSQIEEDYTHYNGQYDRVAWLKEAAPGRLPAWEAAATDGNVQAQFLCGKALQTGAGGEVDFRRSLFYYEKAAKQGLGSAMVNAGRLLAQGKGCQKDMKQAMAYYQDAADQGYSSGLYNMALVLTEGTDMPRDLVRALELWTQLEREGAPGADEYRERVWTELLGESAE